MVKPKNKKPKLEGDARQNPAFSISSFFGISDIKNRLEEVFGPIEEAEYQGRKVTLNKPTRGDVKKFKVYVRDPKTGNVKKVNFGDPNMEIKRDDPARRRSFRARHNCDNPGPKTKARYWSCKKW